jgi:hypothetical protein
VKGKGRNGRGQGASEWIPPCGKAREKQLPPGRGGKLAAASRRERFRVCSCSGSFCLPQELAKEWVIQLVPSSSRADQKAFLKEAGEVLSVDFSGEVMGWNFAFAQAREFTDECAVLGAQL